MGTSKPNAKARASEVRLFIDFEIAKILLDYPVRKRERIRSHFRKMQRSKVLLKALKTADKNGPLRLSVCAKISFGYRLDPAWRSIEIMRMEENE